MNEKLLQYIWNYKLFQDFNFVDTQGNPLEIIEFGKLNVNSGPDFELAKLKYKNLILYGNIELHVLSSDWQLHRHQNQKEYQSIILHVVFEHDKNIPELEKAEIPTLELKQYINKETLEKYSNLQSNHNFIPCEKIFTPKNVPFLFSEEMVLKKLDEKSWEIEQLLSKNKNDYEAVLFQKIAYVFGLKVNAPIFLQIAQSIDFKIINKISQNQFQLESLLLGKAHLLHEDIAESQPWHKEFRFLQSKFNLSDIYFPAKFLRLMPPSFPTIRLSQLATLYHRQQNLFSKIIKAQSVEELKSLFRGIKTSDYWEKHFIFGKETHRKQKRELSEDFIDIILINALFPVIYMYFKNTKTENTELILDFYKQLKAEKNSIINSWKALGINLSSSLDSQAYLYLHKNFCKAKNCLNCGIGFQLLKT